MTRRWNLLLLLVPLAGACASGGGGGNSALYRRDVGTASLNDAVSIGTQIIGRYSYEVFESDTVPEIRILTHWKQRRPFADELALGITHAENRLLIVGRQRGVTELGAFYAVNLTVENRVRVAGNPQWNETTNTEAFRKWADEISNEYRRLIINIGVRRYE